MGRSVNPILTSNPEGLNYQIFIKIWCDWWLNIEIESYPLIVEYKHTWDISDRLNLDLNSNDNRGQKDH